ncbi:adhesive plaque matrix protein [Wyeomyia smithii]|uniref:adhesive plaque matrix protein n=1 Tax=Wyeomyia smithii TaxID=174621 RepID=UPI002467DD09|nr:adhesive plaque matrix protein [Wyeomyia smithii]
MRINKCLQVCLVLCCVVISISALKKKRGLYHGLPGYSIAIGAGAYRPYHSSPYAKFPGFYKGYSGALSPGYALFPGGATVASYQRNFPRIPVYTPQYLPPLGVPSTVLRPVTNFAALAPAAPVAPVAPATPLIPAYPATQQIPDVHTPTYIPIGNTQQTSFFATYPQKPIIPVAVPVPEKPKVPLFIQKPLYTGYPNVIATGVLPAGIYNPQVAVSNVSPTFVGVPIAGPTVSTPAVSTATVPQTAQQPWRPVVLHHPTPAPSTTTAYKPSINLLPPYNLPGSQGQIYISSTPATIVHQDSQQQQQQTLLDLEQASFHHHSQQEDGNGAFNGQPYDVASNHGRYSGPSSYDVDITHNGYQKK